MHDIILYEKIILLVSFANDFCFRYMHRAYLIENNFKNEF